MKNVDLITTKIEKLEGKFKTMYVMLTRPDTTTEHFKEVLNQCEETLEQIKSMIQRRD
jgi:hypothetical protein